MDVFLDSMSVGIPVALLVAAVFVAAALSVGWLSARFVLHASFRHSLSMLVVCFTLGLNIIGVLALLAGSADALRPIFIWTAMISAILAALYFSHGFSGGNFPAKLAAFIKHHSWLLISLTLLFIAGLGSSLCYPFGWDELTYHIAIPARWLNDGSLSVYPDNPYSGFPSLVEILFRTGMGMGGVLFPRLLNLSVCVTLLFSLWLLLRRYTGRFSALAGVAILAVSPLFMAMIREAYVEPFIALNLLSALLALHHLRRSGNGENNRALIITLGILSGGAVAMKLSGVIIPVMLLVAWGFEVYSRQLHFKTNQAEFKKYIITSLLRFAGVAFLFALPFYLRPWIQTGNPIHPYFAGWFVDNPAALLVAQKHHFMAERYGTSGIIGFLAAPITLAARGDLYDAIVLGWQLPAFLSLFLCVWIKQSIIDREHAVTASWIPAIFAIYMTFWYLTAQQSRFTLPLLLIAILAGFQALRWLPRRVGQATLALICVVSAFSIDASLSKHFYYGWKRHCLSWLTNEVYLRKALRDDGYVDAMAALLDKTPKNARIAMLFERRGLYCPRKHKIATPYFQAETLTPPPTSPKKLLENLQAAKIDYLLFGGTCANPDYTDKDNQTAVNLARMLVELSAAGEVRLIWSEKGYNLFRIMKKKCLTTPQ